MDGPFVAAVAGSVDGGGVVGGLVQALDELATVRLDGDVVASADVGELLQARARLEAELLRRVRVWDDHRRWAAEGALSPSGWLTHHGGLSVVSARRLVALAHRLGDAPVTEAALQAGSLSVDQAVIVARASTAPCTARFQADEVLLVEQAQRLAVGQLPAVVRHWRQRAEADLGPVEADPGYTGRHLHASVSWEGTVVVDGVLDPADGAVVLAALEAAMAADRDVLGEPTRTRAQRRADALGVVCRHYLDTASLPVVGGERPHLAVTIDLERLDTHGGARGGRGGGVVAGWSDQGVGLPAAAVATLACDASVHPIFTRGSEPLDIGRRSRTVPTGMRRALIVRDGGCRFPGCDRPPGRCDAHHVEHWLDGGVTALANLLLLCRRHHRLLHHGWTITGPARAPVFTRPDGTTLTAPADLTAVAAHAGPAP